MPAIFDERTPTWEALRLGPHLAILKGALAVYHASLVLAVLHFSKWRLPGPWFDIVAWALVLTYPVLVGETFYIQKVLHDSALYKYRAWHVLVGAVCLSPCFFGWLMPVSLLWAVARVKKQLTALEQRLQAEGRSRAEPRFAGASWTMRGKTAVILGVVALFVLFLAWHFANIQRPSSRDRTPATGVAR